MKRIALICFILLIASSAFGASSRILPSSYNEKTYGTAGAGRDYTSLAAWESDTDNNLVTATKGEVLTCYDDSAPYNDKVTLSGATTSAAYFRVIRAADGHRGTTTSGVRFVVSGSYSSGLYVIDLNEQYACAEDIAVSATNTYTDATSQAFRALRSYSKVIGCTVYDCSGAGTGPTMGINLLGYSTYENNIGSSAINCYVTNADGGRGATRAGIRCYASGNNGTFYLYNNTIRNCSVGLRLQQLLNTLIVNSKNCVFQDNTTNITVTSGTLNQTTNATSGVTFQADGYHLSPSDTVAINAGTDLSSDATFPFNDDIDGQTRSGTWDIGCDEYIATSTAKPQVIIY